MICDFSGGSVCVRCKRETRFPNSTRMCCGSPGCQPTPAIIAANPASGGVGSELKKLLAGWPFRIKAGTNCKCNSRARYMDAEGIDWCESEEGMAEILGFLRESAQERGLPFVDVAARLLVRRAIANARRKEAASAQRSLGQD